MCFIGYEWLQVQVGQKGPSTILKIKYFFSLRWSSLEFLHICINGLPLRPYSSCYKYILQAQHGRTLCKIRTIAAEAGGLSWVLSKSELHSEYNRMKSGFKTQMHRRRKGLMTVRDFYYCPKNIFILFLCFKTNRIQLSVKQSSILNTSGCYWFMCFSYINHFFPF